MSDELKSAPVYMPPGPGPGSPLITHHSSLITSFWALAAHSFRRQWRVRQMGWVAGGLLGLCVVAVAVVTHRPAGWGLADRTPRRGTLTYREYAASLRYDNRLLEPAAGKVPGPTPFDPVRDGVTSLLLSIPAAVVNSPAFLHGWAFMNFSRWVVLGTYLGFVLPLFTLAYASGAIGAEREGRSLIWLLTRPVPRPLTYVATYLGTLPWCLLFGVGGFVALCLAGGELGRRAMGLYWPAAVAGVLAFSVVFHLFGAVFRRPVVVGLVYVFFFEALVAALPGSLKMLSLTFYARSLMYNEAAAAGYPVGMLDVPGAVSSGTAWAVLAAAAVGLTAAGAAVFARAEVPDDA